MRHEYRGKQAGNKRLDSIIGGRYCALRDSERLDGGLLPPLFFVHPKHQQPEDQDGRAEQGEASDDGEQPMVEGLLQECQPPHAGHDLEYAQETWQKRRAEHQVAR